ncbi:MAG: hypothetical protein QM791_06515 [Ferruginibacter sp.]
MQYLKIFITLLLLAVLPVFIKAQQNDFIHDKGKSIAHAQQIVRSVLGDALFKKHVSVDTMDSRIVTGIAYSKTFMNPKRLGIDTNYMVIFQITQGQDTIGYVSVYINRDGKPVAVSRDPLSYSTPELLIGYKRVLLNDFKISYRKAAAIAKQKGFASHPYLVTDTEYDHKIFNKKTYVKVKYAWLVMDIESDKKPVTATMLINAETGEIEKEVYTPRMPG